MKYDKSYLRKKSILIPLHYFPEATIEYWSGDPTKVEFEDMLKCKLDSLTNKYEQIILKEHPATVFDNPSSFYKSIKKNSKVVFIDPFYSTSALLKLVDVVGCWTGTSAIEFLVNGKNVELFCDNQYYRTAMELEPRNIGRNEDLISIKDPFVFIKEILRGTIQVE